MSGTCAKKSAKSESNPKLSISFVSCKSVTICCIIVCFLTLAGGLSQIGIAKLIVATSIDSSTPCGILLLLHCTSVNSSSNILVQSNGLLFDCNCIVGLNNIINCSNICSLVSVLVVHISTCNVKLYGTGIYRCTVYKFPCPDSYCPVAVLNSRSATCEVFTKLGSMILSLATCKLCILHAIKGALATTFSELLRSICATILL